MNCIELPNHKSKLSFFWAKRRTVEKRKNEKSKKTEKSNKSQAKRVMFEKSKGWKFKNPKSQKIEKAEKSNTFWFFAKQITWKVQKIENSKSQNLLTFCFFVKKITRKVEHFLFFVFFCEKFWKVKRFLTFCFFAKKNAIFVLCDYRREERLEFLGYPFSGRPHASFLVVRASWPSHVPLQK